MTIYHFYMFLVIIYLVFIFCLNIMLYNLSCFYSFLFKYVDSFNQRHEGGYVVECCGHTCIYVVL